MIVPKTRNTGLGNPGIATMANRKTDTHANARGWLNVWAKMSLARWPSSASIPDATRVTTNPAATLISRAGICETRPSPMVSSV